LRGERILAAVGLAPAFDRGIERIERKRQTFDSHIDAALLVYRHHTHLKTLAAANV